MTNYSLKIDILKLRGSFLANIKGKTATKKCFVIPVDSPDLYEGEKTLSIDMIAWELQNPKYEDTHMIKVSIKKEVYDAMTKEEKDKLQIIGNLRTFAAQHSTLPVNSSADPESIDDIPF